MVAVADNKKTMLDEIIIKKQLDNFVKQIRRQKGEPYPTYKLRKELRESVEIHAVKGVFPEKLFRLRSPNETDEEIKYRRDAYKQTTLPVFIDYLGVQQRAFSDSNWSIEYAPDNDVYIMSEETFQKYVEEINLEGFVFNLVVPNKGIDANAVLCIKPEIMDEVIADDEQPLYEPKPYIYPCYAIQSYEEHKWYMIDTGRKSTVTFGSNVEESGYIFEFYDENNIWEVVQFGKKNEYTFRITLIFTHNAGRVPVKRLSGVATLVDNELVWQSPFCYATDNLDLVALDNSNLQISKARTAFPIPVMYGIPCEFEDATGNRCVDGKLTNEHGEQSNCSSCGGTGLKTRLGVNRTVLLNPATPASDGDSKLTQDPLKYVSPSPEILDFLRKEISENEQRARKILHLPDADDNIKSNEGQTATGSGNKLKSLYAFIKPISDQVFDLYEFALNEIGWQRYGENFNKPKINRPIYFDFKTEADYIADIESARKSELPAYAIRQSILAYLKTFYFTDSISSKAINLIDYCDRLLGIDNDEITTMGAKGLVAPYEIIIHYSAWTLLQNLLSENPDFFEQEASIQKEQFIQSAKDMAKDLVARDEVIDALTSDSSSQLKSTVGGLVGMIEIIKAVSSGIYERDAAVQLVMERFGLTQEQAERQVGNPKVITSQSAATVAATVV